MKLVYVDESGEQDHSDVFVMAGVLVDAYRLRKHTANFDGMITTFLARHPGTPKELKTAAFINGDGGWSKVDATERKNFLAELCDLVAGCARIFGVAISFEQFGKAAKAGHGQSFGNGYWLGASMFVAALVQKKMLAEKRNKGLSVLICDDNKQGMPNLADALYEANPWFDQLYQTSKIRRDETIWNEIAAGERFDQIVNCAFAIKPEHSSLIQAADVVSYVYRRHLELKTKKEAWQGEKDYLAGLVGKLEPKRERLGRNPGGPCIEFYKAVCHKQWAL
jgi:hypothetical protein